MVRIICLFTKKRKNTNTLSRWTLFTPVTVRSVYQERFSNTYLCFSLVGMRIENATFSLNNQNNQVTNDWNDFRIHFGQLFNNLFWHNFAESKPRNFFIKIKRTRLEWWHATRHNKITDAQQKCKRQIFFKYFLFTKLYQTNK